MNTLTIARRELSSYFRSPIAYGVIAFFALIAGYFFYASVLFFVRHGTEAAMMGQSQPMDVNEYVIRPLFSNISVIALFLIPMITMRLFAEEKRTGTIELLVTSPLTDLSIILGKWLAALILYVVMLATSAIPMAMLYLYGSPDWRPIMVGYLGLLLMGGALLAIGTFISTLTRNQIVAGVATFAVSLMLWILNWMTEFGVSKPDHTGSMLSYAWSTLLYWIESAFAYIAITAHLDSFGKGVIDTKDLVYYLSVIFVALFLTARSLESLRWRA